MGRTPLVKTVGQLAADGMDFFTLDDLAERLGLTRTQAQQLGHRLAKAGFARRVRRGLYALVPPAEWVGGPGTGMDWHWAAANAVRGEPYYLAYYTAMELHGMLQHPLRTVFVAVAGFHRETAFGPIRIRFVKLPPGKLFGAEDRRLASGHVVKVAQLERTFIDCVDRPNLCGGIEEVFRGYARRQRELDPDRLIRLTQRFGRPAITRRVGFMLEAVGHGDPELLWELERIGGPVKHYVTLDKTGQAEGARNKRWGLVVNVDLGRMRAAARA